MSTHLRRADDELRAALAALNPANAATYAAVGHLVEARDHLERIDADDVETHLTVETCQAWRDRSRVSRCSQPADVILDGEGYCASHTCGTCSAEPVAMGMTECGRCDEKWQAEQDAAAERERGYRRNGASDLEVTR